MTSSQTDPPNLVLSAALRTTLILLMLAGIPVIGVLIYLNLAKPNEDGRQTAEVQIVDKVSSQPANQ